MADIRYEYRIHPAVGIARMGNSDTTYYLPNEKPWQIFQPDQHVIPGKSDKRVAGKLRDADNKLAKQAARFRVFCYEFHTVNDDTMLSSHPKYFSKKTEFLKDVWECKSSEYDIEWIVEVANAKTKSIPDDYPEGFETKKKKRYHELSKAKNTPNSARLSSKTDVDKLHVFEGKPSKRLPLGSCFVDDDGRLTFIGSDGAARQILGNEDTVRDPVKTHWAGWEDDACDGPIRAEVTPKWDNGRGDAEQGKTSALRAWVVVGLPNFGADTPATVTLYDVALNHAATMAKLKGGQQRDTSGDSYYQHIRPLQFAEHTVPYTIKAHKTRRPLSIPDYSDSVKDGVPGRYKAYLRPARETQLIVPENVVDAEFVGSSEAYGLPKPIYKYANLTKAGSKSMPNLDYVSITQLQHRAVTDWDAGTLKEGNDRAETSTAERFIPYQLDRAHLETMSGGSFMPGLEVGREAFWPQTWKGRHGCCKEHYDVRVAQEVTRDRSIKADKPGLKGKEHGVPDAGYLTKTLGCPWQADYDFCGGNWWPHARPIEVLRADQKTHKWINGTPSSDSFFNGTFGWNTGPLMTDWWKLGFLRHHTFDDGTDGIIETERLANAPGDP